MTMSKPTDRGHHQGGLSVRAQELIRCFFNRPSSVRTARSRKRRPCRLMPASSSMNAPLLHKTEAKAGRLLRVLFLRLAAVPADAGRATSIMLCGSANLQSTPEGSITPAWAVSFKEGMLAGQVRRTDHVCVNAGGKQRSSHSRKIRIRVFRSVLAKARSSPSIAVESRGYGPTIENIERKQLVSRLCQSWGRPQGVTRERDKPRGAAQH
jgi:hypothetical protein